MTDLDLPILRQRLLDDLCETVGQRAAAEPSPAPTPTPIRRKRRQFVYRAAAAAAIVAGVLVAVESRGSDEAGASFTLTQDADGVITVFFGEGFDDAAGLQARLRDAGVDVEVTAVPASPSNVGVVLAIYGTTDTVPQPGVEFNDLGLTIDTAELDGGIFMRVGVATDDRYQAAGSAFDTREVLDGLQCKLPSPLRAGDLVPYLDQLGITVEEWAVLTPVPNPNWGDEPRAPDAEADPAPQWLTDLEVVDTPPDDAVVLHANSSSPTRMYIEVVDPTVEQPTVPEWQSDFGRTPCTAERVERWS